MGTLQPIQGRALWKLPSYTYGGYDSVGTSRNISASTHWVGGQFIAPLTGTIDQIGFRTGTVASPLLTLTAAITELDANGYPLGTDVAAAGTGTTNPAASTNYTQSLSASVTAGTWYGIILRVSAYTSGSCNIVASKLSFDVSDGVTGNFPQYPSSSYNIGSNTKAAGQSQLAPHYTTYGYVPCLGTSFPGVAGNLTAAATSGNCVGNKFTIARPLRVFGLAMYANADNPCNAEIWAGSDNTALASAAITSAYRTTTSNQNLIVPFAAPVLLTSATYRAGLRNTSAASNSMRSYTSLVEAGIQSLLVGGNSFMQTSYASGAWTDTDTGIAAVSLLVSDVDDGTPSPSLFIGGLN